MTFFLALLGLAAGAELEALGVATEGALHPGIPSDTEFVVLEEGRIFGGLIERAETEGGQLVSLQRVEGHPWSATVQADPGAEQLVLRLVSEDGRRLSVSFPVVISAQDDIEIPGRVEGIAGQEQPLKLTLSSEDQLLPDNVRIWASEGEVQSVSAQESGLEVAWRPSEARQPRMALLAVRDLRRSGALPRWIAMRLRARPPVTVRTEPNTSLSIELGSRSYGPFKAGADGVVTARVDVYPGEQTATAFLSDGLGNTQRTTITVASAPEAVLGVLVDGTLVPGGEAPKIHLKAIGGSGSSWKGSEPKCRAAGGDALKIAKVGDGAWIAFLSESATRAAFDLRVDCVLGTRQQSVHVPVRRSSPHRVVLQVYPHVLSADFPIAQVQAFLEDATGERMGAEGIQLAATAGTLQIEDIQDGSLRGNYRGSPELGEDRLSASYSMESGSGSIWRIVSGWRHVGENIEVSARVLDRGGRPLTDRSVRLRLGEEEMTALSNERGWLEGRFRAVDEPVVFLAEAEAVQHARLLLPVVDDWQDPRAPDLVDHQDLVFQAGRVSQVFISVDPSILFGEPGARADVHVRLLDRGGRTVTGESISVTASEGSVGAPKPLADGSFVARYRPPAGLVLGDVLLSAEGGDGLFAASTTLEIIPRPQSFGIGLSAGYLQGVNGVSGPALSVDFEAKLRWLDGLFQFRGGFMNWRDQATIVDQARNKEIDVHLTNYGIGLHLLARRERDARSAWVGLGAMLSPYSQTARFDEMPLISGWGIHRPGIVLTGGGAVRSLSGEVFGELRWVGMNGRPGEFGYEGSVGGMALLLGYRVIL